MSVFAPFYYKDFKCIADKCKHSCCIGWEIDIDAETYEKYKNIDGNFSKRIKNNIEETNGQGSFILGENERCPFLNDENLCDIIINLGEDMLCDICTLHPRFQNDFDTFLEIGLGMSCEEVARLILLAKEKFTVCPLEEENEFSPSEEEKEFLDFRQRLFDVINDPEMTAEEKAEELLKSVVAEFGEKTYSEWKEVFLSLECLDDAWHDLLKKLDIENIHTDYNFDGAFSNILAYFIYRHLNLAYYTGEYKEAVCFSVLGYKIIRKIFESMSFKTEEDAFFNLLEIARMYSSEIEYSEENTQKLFDIFAKVNDK